MPNRPRYDVVLLNDNETPMEFVVRVLEVFFEMSLPRRANTCFAPTRDIARHLVSALIRKRPNFVYSGDWKASFSCRRWPEHFSCSRGYSGDYTLSMAFMYRPPELIGVFR